MSEIKVVNFSDLQNWSILSYMINTLYQSKYQQVRIGNFLTRKKIGIEIKDDVFYRRATIKINNGGVFLRDTVKGEYIGTKNQFIIHEGQLLLSKIDARNGAFGIVPKELEGGVITGNFWTFEIDTTQILPQVLCNILSCSKFQSIWDACSNGTTNRHYLQEDDFLNTEIPVPSIEEQKVLLSELQTLYMQKREIEHKIELARKQFEASVFE